MSSRSLAAARAKRAGENAPPVSGNRPGTSIGSHAAFAQQMPNNMGYNMPPPPNNVRVARAIQPATQQPPRQTPPQYQQIYEQSQPQIAQPHTQPAVSKLSISDAIGLITIRLGRVEQWILDTEQEEETKQQISGGVAIPDNHKVIDSSVLTSIINRLDLLEKMGAGSSAAGITVDEFKQLSEEVKLLSEQFKRMGDDVHKHTIELAKNTEQVFRFNRELVETKDILKSFMIKYDVFVQDTNKNFSDYEYALSELETRLPSNEATEDVLDNIPTEEGDSVEDIDGENKVMDLKSIVKKELGNI